MGKSPILGKATPCPLLRQMQPRAYSTWARKPPIFGRGMHGPLPLLVVRTAARIPLEHRAHSIMFGRSVVKRSHG